MPAKPTIAELLAAKKAGKKPTGLGIVLRAGEPESQVAAATAHQAELSPPMFDQKRSLVSTYGEAIPATPENATPADREWHSALQAFDAELCLMQDPDPRQERGWIAVRRVDKPDDPILLVALPLWPHPKTQRPENEPF